MRLATIVSTMASSAKNHLKPLSKLFKNPQKGHNSPSKTTNKPYKATQILSFHPLFSHPLTDPIHFFLRNEVAEIAKGNKQRLDIMLQYQSLRRPIKQDESVALIARLKGGAFGLGGGGGFGGVRWLWGIVVVWF